MAWYYAEGGERRGPIDDRAFQQLVAQGTVGPDTLVWKEGMAEWQAYGDVALSQPAAEPSPAAPQEMVELGGGASDIGGSPIPERPSHTADPMASAMGGMRMCTACGNTFPADELVEIEGRSICGACKPTFMQHLREGNTLSVGMIYAGFWKRFAAMILDGFILGIPAAIILGVVMVVFVSGIDQSDPAQAEMMIQFVNLGFQFIFVAITLAYNTYFLGKSGATPGKKIMGIRVVMDDGSPISYGRALGRTAFINFIGGNCTCGIVNIVSAIMVATDDEKRAVHDHVCSTRVIEN